MHRSLTSFRASSLASLGTFCHARIARVTAASGFLRKATSQYEGVYPVEAVTKHKVPLVTPSAMTTAAPTTTSDAPSQTSPIPDRIPSSLSDTPTVSIFSTPAASPLPDVPLSPLAGTEDHYKGMIIEADALPANVEEFVSRLTFSLELWRGQGMRGIWLKIPISKVGFIAPAVEHAGFKFHHAEPEYVMLTHWLPNVPSTLPPNASHQVGVGAFVLNHQQQVLLVQEGSGPTKGRNFWKMPTGLLNHGEDITAGVVREVMEETGVEVVCEEVLAIRQAHGFAFGKSDMFFLCACRTVEPTPAINPQDHEIVAAKWEALEEWTSDNVVKLSPLYSTMVQCCVEYAEGRYKGLTGKSMMSRPNGGQSLFMWVDNGAGDGVEAAQQLEQTGKL